MARQGPPPSQASCDRCRLRKVKCIPLESDELEAARTKGLSDRCKGCYRSNTACTRDYVHKKPGRPLGSGGSRSKRGVSASGGSATARRSASPPTSSSRQVDHPGHPDHPDHPALLLTPTATHAPAAIDPMLLGDGAGGPAFGTIFGSARAAMYPTHTYGHPILDELVLQQDGIDANGGPVIPASVVDTVSSAIWRPEPPQSVAPSQSVSQHHDHTTSAPSLDTPIDFGGGKEYEQGFNLDDVLQWTDVCFFVSLFLKDQHCLVPVVHKPTFSQDVLNRRDRRDEAFRGLLCSMVAYTICQCPISTMTGAYERPRLVTILHRCTRAAESIRHRHRMVPSLVGLASTLLDWITAHAIGNPQVCDIHAAEATRLAHALSLADPHARSTKGNGKRTDFIEQEIRRRLFWIIYSKDKTDALSGRPMILHDFEGVAPFPLTVDDDYITTEGYLPQPARRASYMLGFVTIMRVFQIVSQCVTRHRSFANGHRAGTMGADADVFVAAGGCGAGGGGGGGAGASASGSSDTATANDSSPSSEEAAPLLRWIHSARSRLHTILEDLPPALNNTMADLTEAVRDLDPPADISLFGIQQANITITALCAEFALLDLRASLCPHEDTRAERDDMARKAYDALASIPYEYLASNGESMRGKVLRIVLSLLSMTPEPGRFSQSVWDWWNVFSSFQFLQVIPDETMLLIDQGGGAGGGGGAKKVGHGVHHQHHTHGLGHSPKVAT